MPSLATPLHASAIIGFALPNQDAVRAESLRRHERFRAREPAFQDAQPTTPTRLETRRDRHPPTPTRPGWLQLLHAVQLPVDLERQRALTTPPLPQNYPDDAFEWPLLAQRTPSIHHPQPECRAPAGSQLTDPGLRLVWLRALAPP